MAEQEYTPTEADREDAKSFLIGLSLDGTDETPQSLPAEGVDDIVAELAALFAKVRADERAKRPDREQIDRIQFEIDNVHQIHGDTCLCGFTSSRSRSRTEHLTALFADAVLSSLALEPEAREEPHHALEVDVLTWLCLKCGRPAKGHDKAREVPDAEQCMLVVSASWDATGHQPLPRYVGPFPDRDAAFSWVRHHAPLSGEFNSSPWPVKPEEVSRG